MTFEEGITFLEENKKFLDKTINGKSVQRIFLAPHKNDTHFHDYLKAYLTNDFVTLTNFQNTGINLFPYYSTSTLEYGEDFDYGLIS